MSQIAFDSLATADLTVDAVYVGGRSGNASDDPLSRLIGVNNQGGFRYLGSKEVPKLIVMTSSFDDPDWPDALDPETGILTYYGDNKKPGQDLHDTPRFGNLLLRDLFAAIHARPALRGQVPPILVFGNAGTFRDVRFLGLAVPGAQQLHAMEDLVAIWKIAGGQRFQNYRASFTILDTPHVSRAWLEDVKAGNVLSTNCPSVWKHWIEKGVYEPLAAARTIEHRSKAEQTPADENGKRIIRCIHEHFKEWPFGFEACASKLAPMMDGNFVSFNLTRLSRDGGRDAIGQYRIGLGPSAIFVDCALEAKCYAPNSGVDVKDVSRLISRLRHRQFGVLVTTSYLNSQAYQELKEDRHPVLVISAVDIVSVLATAGYNSTEDVSRWLESEFPNSGRYVDRSDSV
ncbi:MAG: restriction endonuclease [Deltaproteobacteria bacterium]|nr:restriction endonuclease [Deltaproteobacteria bacterium]